MLGAALGMRLTAPTLLLMALCGLLAGAGLLMLSVGSYWPSLAGVLLLGLSCGPVFPTALALITAAARGGNGAAGLALGLGNSGGLVLPALLGLTLARYGPSAMIGTLLAFAIAMLALGVFALRNVGAPPTLAALRRRG
jgi:fucose permease